VIRFIVNQIKPDLTKSEKVLDPACGTGGFLVESLEYMKKDEKSKADIKKLRTDTLFGIEKKPMPYLLAMMNMLLHEIVEPDVVRTNTLVKPLREITEENQYDVIMTNPPFGGEEEAGISSNLPVGMQTSDTALAFLLFIMYSLKSKGRCAIILPNGPLFAGGIAAKIKQKLLEEFNLHTIIRMPNSVFSPYTNIATNILFFEKSGKTKEIWYYQMKIRDGLKAYNKTNPISYEDFADVIKWWNKKTENGNAWKVKVEDIVDYNVDRTNPNILDDKTLEAPEKILNDIIQNNKTFSDLIIEMKKFLYAKK
jgi:type I restriction enzyme M protein